MNSTSNNAGDVSSILDIDENDLFFHGILSSGSSVDIANDALDSPISKISAMELTSFAPSGERAIFFIARICNNEYYVEQRRRRCVVDSRHR